MTETHLGKIAVVTGATDGIGKVTALELARRGMTVVGIGRNPEKIAATIAQAGPHAQNLTFLQADLSSIAQIRRAAAEFKAKHTHLHVLVNNAGAMFPTYRESADGIEMTFALNHLSYFLLTTLLLDCIESSAPARIINVSSSAHRNDGLNLDKINDPTTYSGWTAYSASKFANVLFTYELARRLQSKSITVNAVHPGFVDTNFQNAAGMNMRGQLTPEQGADTQIWLATADEVEGVTGKYFVNRQAAPTVPDTYDEALAHKLWEVSEALVQQHP
ncbi:MAG: SDR family oxidoreductase [Anaerolineae bacterium]